MNVELVHEAGAVGVYRFDGQVQFAGNFFRAKALGDQAQHFGLVRGKLLGGSGGLRGCVVGVFGNGGAKVGLAT